MVAPPAPGHRRRFTPDAAGLAHLEQLVGGGYAPLRGFLGGADAHAVEGGGRLRDGTPWPVPVVLGVPDDVYGGDALELCDPEGAPVAALDVTEAWTAGEYRFGVSHSYWPPPCRGHLAVLTDALRPHGLEPGIGETDAIHFFEEHNAAVQREVPADRLLVYQVSQGWAPLCEFLGVPQPDTDFPRVNDSATFQRAVTQARATGAFDVDFA